MFARHFIDSLEFARHGREIQGVAPLAEMPRLQDMLAAPGGEISYVVRGLPDWSGKPTLEVAVQGVCKLRCQRCLEALDYPISLVSHLMLAPSEELDEFADEESEEADSIAADSHLDVLNMVEDEILLSLPFAPRHPEGACKQAVAGLNPQQANPFAVLAGLKKS